MLRSVKKMEEQIEFLLKVIKRLNNIRKELEEENTNLKKQLTQTNTIKTLTNSFQMQNVYQEVDHILGEDYGKIMRRSAKNNVSKR